MGGTNLGILFQCWYQSGNTGTVFPDWYQHWDSITRLVPTLEQYSQIGTNTGTIFPDWYQYWDSIPRLVPTLGQYSQIGTNTGIIFPDWYQHWDSIPRLVPPSKYCQILPNFNPVALQTAEIWTLKKIQDDCHVFWYQNGCQ